MHWFLIMKSYRQIEVKLPKTSLSYIKFAWESMKKKVVWAKKTKKKLKPSCDTLKH